MAHNISQTSLERAGFRSILSPGSALVCDQAAKETEGPPSTSWLMGLSVSIHNFLITRIDPSTIRLPCPCRGRLSGLDRGYGLHSRRMDQKELDLEGPQQPSLT